MSSMQILSLTSFLFPPGNSTASVKLPCELPFYGNRVGAEHLSLGSGWRLFLGHENTYRSLGGKKKLT